MLDDTVCVSRETASHGTRMYTVANFDFGDIFFWESFVVFANESITVKDARDFLWKYV